VTRATVLGIYYRMTLHTDSFGSQPEQRHSGLHPLDTLTLMWLGGGVGLAALLFWIV
jgi:hypothetical protein